MNILSPGIEDFYPQGLINPAQAQFLFSSSHRSIRTSGIAERISTPVDAEGKGDAHFQKNIRDAFNRARAKGIANPIVIGAIPFDLSQPVSLAIPESYETFVRTQATDFPRAETKQTLTITSSRSLPNEARFKQAVQQAIANFQLSDIRKAVLSRILDVELAETVNVDPIFARLVAQNPSGFHFRIPLVDGAELIGASPELLIRKQGDAIYSNPLAGSAKRNPNPETDRKISETLLQSDKDAYEHQLVIDDIRKVLTPLCERIDIPHAPQLMSTQAMWHLSTPIDGVLADASMSSLQVASRLHPTPAVCGQPTALARKLINLVEPFERGLFTGMVGWCDGEGNGEWAVTIRCGLIRNNHIQLFAGAGIVEDSCPESEWAETQAKLQTMLNALGVELPRQHINVPVAEAVE